MTSMKVAVSLPRETFRRATRAVRRGRAASLSAHVAIDAAVVLSAREHELPIATSDPDDLRRIDPKVRLVAI